MSETATVRSVTVRLNAEIAKYVADVRTASRETDKAFAGVNTRLSTTDQKLGDVATGFDRVETAQRKVTNSTSRVDTTTSKLNRTLDGSGKSIDRYSGRLGLIGDALLAIGPALIPIGAVAVPAVAALGTEALFAGAAFGVTKLAVHGVGDALTKLNKAALDPTDANLKAARLAMDKLPPSARAFTLELRDMQPEVQRLQRIAANGLLPGAAQGLHALTGDLPIVRRGVRDISAELGVLSRDTGKSLASERWKPFLRFVGQEAPSGLAVMGRSVGAVGHGLSQLFMDFLPSTQDFERGILAVARDFDRWASSVGKTRGFQDFLAYVDANGPRVIDLLGNTATTFIDISRAAAPLGGPILDTLNVFLRVIDAIANSNLGTPIFTGIVAMRLMARTTELWGKASTTSAGRFIASQREAVTAIRATLSVEQRAVMTTQELAAAQQRSSAGWSTIRGGALKAGGAAAGFGLIASGVTDKLHLTNTATLAMAGSLAGPWGTAIGAGAGLILDFTHRQDDSAAATSDFTSTLNQQTGAITGNTKAMAAQVLQQDGALDAADKLGISTQLVTQASLGNSKAQAQLQAQLDTFTGVTQPQYIAGGRGMYSVNQEQALAAGKLSTEFTKVSGTIKGNQADLKQLRGALGGSASSANRARVAHHRLQLELAAEKEAAAQTAQQFLVLGDDIDNTKVSLSRWITQLQREATALENFGNNAKRAADKGLRDGLIKQLEAAGPAGALRMRQLANATQSEIAKANHAWDSGKHAANDYQAAVAYIANHPANVSVNGVPESIHEIRMVEAALRAIHDKVVHITTERATGGRSLAGADGGTIPGQRAPYGDKVLIHAAPGEEIITNRHGEADRFRTDRAMGRIPAYAAGGTVATSSTRSQAGLWMRSPELAHEMTGVRGHLHSLSISLASATKTLDAERQARQNLVQNEQQLAASVRDQFRSDIFGTDSVWGAASNPDDIVRGDIRGARQFRHLLEQVQHRGGSPAVLAQIGTLEEAQQAAGLSRHDLRQLSHDVAVRRRLTQNVGQFAGMAVFGDRIAEQTKVVEHQLAEVRHLRREVHQSNQELAAIRKHAASNAKDTASALDKGAVKAARKVPR